MERQRGGKSSPILFTNIINEFPPHSVFWELCAGSGEITKKKKRANMSFLVDASDYWRSVNEKNVPFAISIQGDVKDFLKELQYAGPNHLIYIDPPYLKETRPNSPKIYDHEMSFCDHLDLLQLLLTVRSNVVISHYPCPLYDEYLKEWRQKTINVTYHGVPKIEKVYMNFPAPEKLHDVRYCGKDKSERQQIKRQAQRWVKRFRSLPLPVKQYILTTLQSSGVISLSDIEGS